MTWLVWRLRVAWARHRHGHLMFQLRQARAAGDVAAEDALWDRLAWQVLAARRLEMAEPLSYPPTRTGSR